MSVPGHTLSLTGISFEQKPSTGIERNIQPNSMIDNYKKMNVDIYNIKSVAIENVISYVVCGTRNCFMGFDYDRCYICIVKHCIRLWL